MSDQGLIRTLSKREVLVLAVGAMIGWSWVIMTGVWLSAAGTLGTLLAFLVGGFAILLISLTWFQPCRKSAVNTFTPNERLVEQVHLFVLGQLLWPM